MKIYQNSRLNATFSKEEVLKHVLAPMKSSVKKQDAILTHPLASVDVSKSWKLSLVRI